MSEPYSVLSIPEIEPISVAGVQWKPLRRTLGIDAFGINAYSAPAAGDHVVEEHTEETLGHQEAYIVIVGHATFTLDADEIDAPQGTVVFVRDPSVRRSAVAVEPGTTVLAIGGVPGVHTPSAWEWYFEAEKFRESGDHEAALELLADAAGALPGARGRTLLARLLAVARRATPTQRSRRSRLRSRRTRSRSTGRRAMPTSTRSAVFRARRSEDARRQAEARRHAPPSNARAIPASRDTRRTPHRVAAAPTAASADR